MGQCGVPFGKVNIVRDWLGICGQIGKPGVEHPKRPVAGFDCHRSEVSGARLWGWARDRFGTPNAFFARFFIANYCPLVFMGESGVNITPDRLQIADRVPLFTACDAAMRQTIACFLPRVVVGVGKFAEGRLRVVLGEGTGIAIDSIPHPSPASPQANVGWASQVNVALSGLGGLRRPRGSVAARCAACGRRSSP